jgi:hypothetical protein
MGFSPTDKWIIEKAKRIKLRVVTRSDDALWRECEKLEYDVFFNCGYIPASDDQRFVRFDRYDNMEFMAAFVIENGKSQCQKHLSGLVRVIYSSDPGKPLAEQFPTLLDAKLLDFPSHEAVNDPKLIPHSEDIQSLWLYSDQYDRIAKLDPRKCIDLATMAILPSRRDGKTSKALITGVLLRGWENPPVRYALGAMDEIFFKKANERNLPFEALGPSVMYLGSPTLPVLVDSYKIPKGFQKLLIPLYRLKGHLKRFVAKERIDG